MDTEAGVVPPAAVIVPPKARHKMEWRTTWSGNFLRFVENKILTPLYFCGDKAITKAVWNLETNLSYD
jgi:hypothetical protein